MDRFIEKVEALLKKYHTRYEMELRLQNKHDNFRDRVLYDRAVGGQNALQFLSEEVFEIHSILEKKR